MIRYLSIIMFLALGLASATAQELRATHPLDALTPAEIQTVVETLRAAGHADDKTVFPVMELHEPLKKDVLSWKVGEPFIRAAHIVTRRSGMMYEAVVDILQKKVLAHHELPGAQPPIMQAEWSRALELTRNDKRVIAAMRARGIPAHANLICTPLPAGYRDRADTTARRLLRVPCYVEISKLHPLHARSIEGIVALVDPDAGEVVDVLDTGQSVPIGDVPGFYKPLRPGGPVKPVVITLPKGSNIKVKGAYQVEWHNWSFHLRADRRAGVIVSLVRFNDHGTRRLVAYQMSVAEMFVPYMDPDPTWAFRGYLDAGELGLGYLISSLGPGRDCPRQSFFVNLLLPSDQGGMFRAPRAMCIFERATGDPAWRHYDPARRVGVSQPEVELVVRHIPTIGNYDYVIDYVFQPRGNIRFRIGATGLDATRNVTSADMASPNASVETRFGALIAPYTVAPYHDHYVSYRLDLDVDGSANTFVRDSIGGRALVPKQQRSALWIVESEDITREGPVGRKPGAVADIWRIANTNRTTGLKYNPSYQIEAGHAVRSILPADDALQARAAFARHSLWLTKHRRGERWAAGAFPLLAKPGQGLPRYVADQQNIANTDIVAWYTLGFRHITRPEDFPILPTRWHEFQLRPVHFFDRDPSASLNIEHLN